jgi:septum formation protein
MMKTKLIKHPVVLASQSPRRVALLKQMGIECVAMPPDIDETPLENELADAYVLRLAQQKARAIVSILPAEQIDSLVLGADTTVALNGEILGKPLNEADAFLMLKKLSGTTHQVHTAVAVIRKSRIESVVNTTQVEMMALSDDMMLQYIATGEPLDKAGSYAIQGFAGTWIKCINGSYTGVMGLPVFETANLLQNLDQD